MGNYKLHIYKVIEGTDNWPWIDTIYGETKQDCIDRAEMEYGSDNGYHWTNPIETDWQD